MNPFAALLKSRKFWLMILDLVVSLSAYFLSKYAPPEIAKDILYIIGMLQPVFVVVIAAIASEDNAQRAADTATLQSKNDLLISVNYASMNKSE